MSVIRRKRTDADAVVEIALMKARPEPGETAIEAMAAKDGGAWTQEDFARAEWVASSPSAAEIKVLRLRPGRSETKFARRFGFTLSAPRQYEYGLRGRGGTATILTRLARADPGGVARAPRLRTS